MSAALFDERLAHRVDTVFESELHAVVVVFGEGADAEVDARKVEPFARAQFTAHDDPAADITALNLLHIDLNQTVVEVEVSPGFTTWGRRVKVTETRCASPITSSVVRVKRSPGFSSIGSRSNFPMRILGPGRSAMMARRRSGGPGRGPEILDHLLVAREIAVGEIEPGDVHAGQQQLLHHLPGP